MTEILSENVKKILN